MLPFPGWVSEQFRESLWVCFWRCNYTQAGPSVLSEHLHCPAIVASATIVRELRRWQGEGYTGSHLCLACSWVIGCPASTEVRKSLREGDASVLVDVEQPYLRGVLRDPGEKGGCWVPVAVATMSILSLKQRQHKTRFLWTHLGSEQIQPVLGSWLTHFY